MYISTHLFREATTDPMQDSGQRVQRLALVPKCCASHSVNGLENNDSSDLQGLAVSHRCCSPDVCLRRTALKG